MRHAELLDTEGAVPSRAKEEGKRRWDYCWPWFAGFKGRRRGRWPYVAATRGITGRRSGWGMAARRWHGDRGNRERRRLEEVRSRGLEG